MRNIITTSLAALLLALAAVPVRGQDTNAGAPGRQTLLKHTQHFTEPAKGPEFVMPVGSGDLAAMVSFDTALQVHLSKSGWLGPAAMSPTAAGASIAAPGAIPAISHLSPGHVTVALANLPPEAIRKFDQFTDLDRGCVTVNIETLEGPLTMEVYGDMESKAAMLIHVSDQRTTRGEARITFPMWRENMTVKAGDSVITGVEVNKVALGNKPPRDPAAVARLDPFYNLGLGIAIGAADHSAALAATARQVSATEAELLVPAEKSGDFYAIVTANNSYDGEPLPPAVALLRTLQAQDKETHRARQIAWWHKFWDQSWIELAGSDAAYLSRLWYTSLFAFAGVSQGKLPAYFTGGGPWMIMRDYHSWGWGTVWQNFRLPQWPMGAANHIEFTRTCLDYFDRNFNHLKKSTAAKGKLGFYTAVRWFGNFGPGFSYHTRNSPEPEPKETTHFTPELLEKVRCDYEKEYGYHIHQEIAETVQMMFDYVRYTGDDKFLRDVAGPWLKEATLFYLSYLKKGDDGLWHMTPSDAIETWKELLDPMTDLCAVRYCFMQTAKFGQSFGFEPELIAIVKDRLDHLPPLPRGKWCEKTITGDELLEFKAKILAQPNPPKWKPSQDKSLTVFSHIDKTVDCYSVAGGIGDSRVPWRGNMEHPELYLVMPFAFVGLDSPPDELTRAANTFASRPFPNTYGWSQCGPQAARLGLKNTVDVIMHFCQRQQQFPYGGFINCAGPLPGAVTKVPKEAARFITDTPWPDTAGVFMTALQETLLQSHNLAPDEQLLDGGPIRLLPAIRPDWSGRFKLLARGGFTVECQFANGQVKELKILSERGRKLRLLDPWTGKLIERDTRPGEKLVFTGEGSKP